jgi:hypothetical protein
MCNAQCGTNIITIHLQKFSIIPNRNSVFIKQCASQLSIRITNTYDRQLKRKKGLFRLSILEVLVHNQLGLCWTFQTQIVANSNSIPSSSSL